MAAAKDAVDWNQYFDLIKPVCPWSWAAWQKKEIWIGTWGQGARPLEDYQARIYLVKNQTPRRLKKLCQKLDHSDPNCEWLWSHPRYKKYSTPRPVLIQQDRRKLNQLRKGLARTQ